jgi:hypothetical protein
MNTNPPMLVYLVPGPAMMLVALVAAVSWWRVSRARIRWFWAGVGLWTVAVVLKFACAALANAAVIGFLKRELPYPLLVAGGGLYVGLQSSVFEMGLTLAAVLVWRQLGRDAGRAIAVGVGAGAFEAFLLGAVSLAAMLAVLAKVPGTEPIGKQLDAVAAVTPLFWLAAPAERIIAILCHASTRALILLGVVHRRPMMVFWGFLIFTLLDGVAGAVHVSGKMGAFSVWWIELAVLPFALVSIPILRWCYWRWREPAGGPGAPTDEATGDAVDLP